MLDVFEVDRTRYTDLTKRFLSFYFCIWVNEQMEEWRVKQHRETYFQKWQFCLLAAAGQSLFVCLLLSASNHSYFLILFFSSFSLWKSCQRFSFLPVFPLCCSSNMVSLWFLFRFSSPKTEQRESWFCWNVWCGGQLQRFFLTCLIPVFPRE